MLQELLSTCQSMYDQVDQIDDVKICIVNNVETKYYRVKWKCTWEPEAILRKICGNIINDYTRSTQSVKNQEEPPYHNVEQDASNIIANITETLTDTFTGSSFTVLKEKDGKETGCCTSIELNDIIKEENIENIMNVYTADSKETLFSNIVLDADKDLASNSLNIFNILNLTGENEKQVETEFFETTDSMQVIQKCDVLNKNYSVVNNSIDSKDLVRDPFHQYSLITGQDAIQSEEAMVDDKELTNNNDRNVIENHYDRKTKGKCKSSNTFRKRYKEFCCNRCSFSSPYLWILRKHTRKHTREKPYKCGRCSFSTTTKQALKRHRTIHTSMQPWKCDRCSFATSIKECLTEHISIHHNEEKKFKCQLCSFSTLYSCSLKRHMLRLHTGEKTFKCDQCSYTAFEKRLLNFHVAKHTGLKPFKCNVCSYASSMKGALTKHMRIHASKKTIQM